MPIVVQSRTYDEAFYQALRRDGRGGAAPNNYTEAKREMDDLFY